MYRYLSSPHCYRYLDFKMSPAYGHSYNSKMFPSYTYSTSSYSSIYHYGRQRRSDYSWLRDSLGKQEKEKKPQSPKPKPPKPEVPKEEVAKLLKVEDIDLKIEENAFLNYTDKYWCTQSDRTRDGKELPAECVVRRGSSMKMVIEFERKFEKAKNDLKLVFKIGKKPLATKGTRAMMKIDESEKSPTYKHDEWGANLIAIEGKTVTIQVFIPSNCIIGEWNLSLVSQSSGKDKDGKKTKVSASYDHDTDVTILFNPWCQHDLVYTEEDKDEYILNDSGFIYAGRSGAISAKHWVFGQSAKSRLAKWESAIPRNLEMILECSLHLVRIGMDGNYKAMSNPVTVCRVLAAMLNAPDDNGVLVGNWSGKYDGGVSPLTWIGSKNILKQYLKTKQPIKYGQCWVFSGLLTTVCRALGIPARSVTNFASAHDTDKSCTIDTYFNADGSQDKDLTNDSVWNFHVWNEVYMKRPDIAEGGYDGWQALDATPQELSEGIFTCGPAPIKAIKEGKINVGFDTPFIFSEVNADRIYWGVNTFEEDSYFVMKTMTSSVGKKISTDTGEHKSVLMVFDQYLDNNTAYSAHICVGKNISTKKPGKVKKELNGLKWRQDVTLDYKYPEGSEKERMAVKQAYRLASNPKDDAYVPPSTLQELKMDISCDQIVIGETVDINFTLTNPGKHTRSINQAKITCHPESYTGETGNEMPCRFDIDPLTIKPKETLNFNKKLSYKDYYDYLWDDNYVKVRWQAIVDPIESEHEQFSFEESLFQIEKPELYIEAPWDVEKGKQATFTVQFKNTMPIPLTHCKLSVQSPGFEDLNDMEIQNLDPNQELKYPVDLCAEAIGDQSLVFELDCREIRNISGLAVCYVWTKESLRS